MQFTPRVLLVHSDTATLESWSAALTDCAVAISTDITKLDAIVESHRPDVMVGLWNKNLTEQLRARWATIRFIHFGEALSHSVLDAIAQGNEVFHVERIEDLATKVFAVARPVRLTSRRETTDLEIGWEGAPHRFEIVDVSSNGFSFLARQGDDLAKLQHGTALEQVEITRDGQVALAQVSACVRRIDVRETGYLIGCELRRSFAEPQAAPRVITDRALCAGLLHSAVQSGVLFLTEPESGHLLQPADGSVDPDRKELTIASLTHSLHMFDVIEGNFELSGGAYRFRAAVCGESPLKLRIPAFLEETRQRATPRWRSNRERLAVTLASPLLAGTIERTVHDLSVCGLSFDADATDVLPLGMSFDRIELKLGNETLQLRGRVRNLARGPESVRCGVKLEGLDDAQRAYLTDFIVHARYAGVENGRTASFPELWQFFRDAGFVYPEKEAVLAPLMPRVQETFELISARPNAVSRSVAIREDGHLVGYCSGLKAYRATWMFHHLAALPGSASGTLLSMGINEHVMQSAEYDYFRMWFFAEASFPRRIFGGFARKVADAAQSSLRYFSHFHVPVDRRFGGEATGIETSAATDDELFVVERYFIRHEQPLIIGAEDLTAHGLRLDVVDRAYGDEGLVRRRHVIAAHRNGVMVGFALAEASSPGLNLSEALSSFRVFVLSAGEAEKSNVQRALIDAALTLYTSLGRVVGRCLIDPSEAPDFEALGIEVDRGRSMCWTGARVQLAPFAEHMRSLFARLARRARPSVPKSADAA